MQNPEFAIFSIVLYGLVIWLILYQVDLRVNFYGKLKCKLGLHKRYITKDGQKIKKYKCEFCKKPKKHPHLKLVDGGKKNVI